MCKIFTIIIGVERVMADGMDNLCWKPCSRSFQYVVSVPIGCGFAGPCHRPIGNLNLMPGDFWWDSGVCWLIRKGPRCPDYRRRSHFRCSRLGVGLWLASRVLDLHNETKMCFQKHFEPIAHFLQQAWLLCFISLFKPGFTRS